MPSHPFDKLPLNDGGTLIFTPCPGTKDASLRDALAQLAQGGARAVVTVMPDDEMARNEVTELPEACRDMNLEWFHFPIADDTSPGEAFHQAWGQGRERVFGMLDRQEAVAIHCKGGSGRTGLMAAIIMLERGMPFDEVMDKVRSLRPRALSLAVHTDHLARNYRGGGAGARNPI